VTLPSGRRERSRRPRGAATARPHRQLHTDPERTTPPRPGTTAHQQRQTPRRQKTFRRLCRPRQWPAVTRSMPSANTSGMPTWPSVSTPTATSYRQPTGQRPTPSRPRSLVVRDVTCRAPVSKPCPTSTRSPTRAGSPFGVPAGSGSFHPHASAAELADALGLGPARARFRRSRPVPRNRF